jgi:hypothetical protein
MVTCKLIQARENRPSHQSNISKNRRAAMKIANMISAVIILVVMILPVPLRAQGASIDQSIVVQVSGWFGASTGGMGWLTDAQALDMSGTAKAHRGSEVNES